MKKLIAVGMLDAGSLVAMPAVANAAPADGRCVAQGAGFTFDGPTKASVARDGLMSFIIKDHAFNNADETEALLGITICD
jgi:hypothetical protein